MKSSAPIHSSPRPPVSHRAARRFFPLAARLHLLRRPTKAARARALAMLLAMASLPFFTFGARATDTQDVVIANTSLTTAGNFSSGAAPAGANDVVFGPLYPAAATTFTISSAAVTYGSLNDFNSNALTIQTGSAGTSSITLGGASNTGNSVAPNSADLLYVGPSSSLTIANGTGTLNLILAQNGNFDVAAPAATNVNPAASNLTINSNISGNFALTKTGNGTLTLGGVNTFSTLNLNAGTVQINNGTQLLSATGTINFNGGTLQSLVALDVSARYSTAAGQLYNLNINSATVINATALTSSGGVLNKSGGGVLNLTGANTFSGATTISTGNVAAGSILLSGANGSLASTTITMNGGGLTLTNTGVGGNNNNRIADTATINLNSGTFTLAGSDQTGVNTAETVGSFVIGTGSAGTLATGNANSTVITVAPNATGGGVTTLTAGSLTRPAGGLITLVNGAGLGSSTASTSQFFVTTAPTLVGAGTPAATGNPGTGNTQLNTGIVPGYVGESSTTTGTGVGTATGAANTFLTYTATGGFRPLNPTDEFSSTITAGNNVRIAATPGASSAGATINSLIVGGAAATTLTLTSQLTISSGMILFSPNANQADTITGSTVAFGANEGLIYSGGTVGTAQTIASAVTGSNGITVSGPGFTTISGNITLSGGTLANTGNRLTLSGTNNLTGATVTSSAGNGGALYVTSTGALTGASSINLTNNSQLRDQSAANTITAALNIGDATTTGNLFLNGSGNASNFTFSGLTTLNSPLLGTVLSYNTGNNAVALTGGITSVATTGTGGIEFAGGGGSSTADHRISLSGTLNYVGPTQISSQGANLRVALVGTALPSATVLGFRNTVVTVAGISQFDLNGNDQTVAGLQTITAGTGTVAQVINSSATTSTFTVNNSNSYVFSGTLGTVGAINAGGTAPNATGSTATIILAAGTSNAFNLVKTGTGMLQLAGANSYTGTTTVNGGTLIFGGTGGAPATPVVSSGTGAITVNNTGSILGGTGSLAGAITINTGANITGGSAGAVGALTLAGTAGTTQLTLAAGSTYLVDLGTGNLSDTLKITGNLLSNGATILINSGTLDGTDNYTIATYSADTGSTFAFNAGSSGYTLVDNGTSLVLTAPVPEPSTYVGGLLLVGALGWNVYRRRRVA